LQAGRDVGLQRHFICVNDRIFSPPTRETIGTAP
jgi:hypothetical protein